MTKSDILVVGDYADYDHAPMQATYSTWAMDEGGTPYHLPAKALDAIRGIAFRGHSFLSGDIMDRLPNLGMIANLGV